MFRKKKCKNCNEKISTSYTFCPYCSAPTSDFFEDDSKDWGLLGKDDSPEYEPEEEIKLPAGINMLFNTLMNSLSKQMKELEKSEKVKNKKDSPKVKKSGIGISIHTSGNKPPEIKVTSFGNMPKAKEQNKKIEKSPMPLQFPKANSRKFIGLPKEEPKTNIRRFSDKVIYEIDMPEVKSLEDISISQFEKSIEIKALAKNKVFQKIIPINLPIKKYDFSKKKLVLELDAE